MQYLEVLTSASILKSESVQLTAEAVSPYGLNSRQLIKAWIRSTPEALWTESIPCQIDAIRSLEAQQPGICSELMTQFGIRNFARYPQPLLIQQSKESSDTITPYGLAVFGVDDWNAHLFTQAQRYQQLRDQLNPYSLLRIYEVDNKITLAKTILRAHQRYGAASFGIIAAHCGTNGVQLGFDDHTDRRYFSRRDFNNHYQLISRVADCFKKDTALIIDGCRAGRLGGICRELSTLGFMVTGSLWKNTYVRSFNPFMDKNGNIRFDAKFFRSPQASYHWGAPIPGPVRI